MGLSGCIEFLIAAEFYHSLESLVPHARARLSFVDWCVVIGTLCALGTVVYAALERHFPKGAAMDGTPTPSRRALPIVLAFVACLAVGFDFVDRHYYQHGERIEAIRNYGYGPNNIFIEVDGKQIAEYADAFKGLFVARTSFSNVDRMSDTVIAKSITYTITPDIMIFSIPNPKLRINSGQLNLVEFDLVVIPKDISPDHILSLADVQRLGGEIIVTRGKTDVLFATPPSQPQQPSQPAPPQ